MAHFDVNIIIIARENSCKIGRAPYGVRLIFYNAGMAPYDIVRCPAGHRPMFLYTDTGRRPYDMWPRKRKFLKIVRCPGDYQIRRWIAHRWNRTMSVLFVTIALAIISKSQPWGRNYNLIKTCRDTYQGMGHEHRPWCLCRVRHS